MRARAPGKLVLSGAYAVLEGAPAIVAAVDRFALADAARPAERVTEEVQAAIDLGLLDAPAWFDAAPLRAGDRKLGLGSSAAILVATMAARAAARGASSLNADAIFAAALAAHRRAQGGGSGVDVAASTYGGVLRCALALGVPALVGPGVRLDATRHELPEGLVVEVFASAAAARTSAMLERVRAFSAGAPGAYRALMDAAAAGAAAAAAAASVPAFVAALDAQVDALGELGDRAGAPIVTAEVRGLRGAAAAEGAALAPSGAGGGDVAIYVGRAAPTTAFRTSARARGLLPEPMSIGARGVHLLEG